MSIEFPADTTKKERALDWPKLAEISDADFGFTDLIKKPNRARFDVRMLLLNDSGKLCVIRSKTHGFIQIPGGGVEPGENLEQALRRETIEETGFEITDIKSLGYVRENRTSERQPHDWNHSISFVFTAKPTREVGTNYTPGEITEGFEPIWLDPVEALQSFESSEGHIADYAGNFSNRRDLILTQTIIDLVA